MKRFAAVVLAAAALAAPAVAQFDHRWAEFQPDPAALQPPASSVSATDVEVSFAQGDLDQDGWIDLVVARKAPFDTVVGRSNLLLMNVLGSLVDKTATLGSASDVSGDQGLRTQTCDTGATIADLDGDGRPDVVTAAQGTAATPKALSHPRVYRNLGATGGTWLGLRHEDGRVPQLTHPVSGLPVHPRFSSVSAGDVDGDGDLDLFFSDNDGGFGAPAEPAADDANDRLLLNDGNGFFADGAALSTTSALVSAFGMDGTFVDLNGDGALDLLKLSTNESQPTRAVYQLNGSLGTVQSFHNFAPYALAVSDLNRDGRPDAVLGDDLTDRVRYNLATNAVGQVTWSPPVHFQFLAQGDDGFTGPAEIADLDADGWNDVIIADVDTVVSGFFRRTHVYHNPGGAVGSQIQLREERQNATQTGWIGAVGLKEADLKATYDTEAVDLDRDGDLDLVLGRSVGTSVWENVTVVCQEDLGYGTPGGALLSMCGNPLKADGVADLDLTQAPPSTPLYLLAGLTANPTPVLGGTLVPDQVLVTVLTSTDASGAFSIPALGAFGAPITFVLQGAYVDPSQPFGAGFSNALRIVSQ